ncbi:hypothetical protein PV04_08474 [Phialophora macrospora]|uniref:Uncharacterized protein n=1 Tax=Phialophora macrospora TaxID=1851006 RepID=A0A0D2FHJ6_9EURO|nr:hypothetical protein PV04_08474 [Phialophora macrospora]
MSAIDSTQFADEVYYMSTDINTGIDDTMYENLIMFLQRLSGANDSAIPQDEQDMHTAMDALDAAVKDIRDTGNDYNGGVWSDPQVTSCVRQLRGEGHCLNLFTFIDALVNKVDAESGQTFVDNLNDIQLKTTLINVGVQTSGLFQASTPWLPSQSLCL